MIFKPKKDKVARQQQLGRAVEEMLVKDYVELLGSTKHLVWHSFVRGVFTGLGGVVGATVMVALLLWVLSLFVDFPLIGEFVKQFREGIQK